MCKTPHQFTKSRSNGLQKYRATKHNNGTFLHFQNLQFLKMFVQLCHDEQIFGGS